MGRKTLLLLSLFAVFVIVLAVSIPVKKTNSIEMPSSETPPEESSNTSVSDLFKTEDRKDKQEVQAIPTDIPKDQACTLNGQIVREGTVASNAICVNETPSVTPQI
jgi:hypothetical protein